MVGAFSDFKVDVLPAWETAGAATDRFSLFALSAAFAGMHMRHIADKRTVQFVPLNISDLSIHQVNGPQVANDSYRSVGGSHPPRVFIYQNLVHQ